MQSKAQVTLFIIVGLVMLLTGSLIYYFLLSVQQADQIKELTPALAEEFFLKDCVEKDGKELIRIASISGGHVNLPETTYFGPEGLIPYYYDANNVAPTLEELEGEISEGMDLVFDLCYEDLRQQTTGTLTKISFGEPKIRIYDESIVVEFNKKVTVAKGDAVKEISDIKTEYNYPYGKYYKLSKNWMEKYVENEGWISLKELSESQERTVAFLGLDRTTIFSVVRTMPDGSLYEFVTAVRI